MKLYVIDTNIIFSAIHRPISEIGEFFGKPSPALPEMIAPSRLIDELGNHRKKLIRLTGLTDDEVAARQTKMLTHIRIILDERIPIPSYMKAAPLVRDVDPDDIAFVALNEHADAWLVTGDTELRKGLIAKGYKRLLTFREFKDRL